MLSHDQYKILEGIKKNGSLRLFEIKEIWDATSPHAQGFAPTFRYLRNDKNFFKRGIDKTSLTYELTFLGHVVLAAYDANRPCRPARQA